MPLAASQMRAVLSHDAVTMREPSGLNAADTTDDLMPAEASRHSASKPLLRARNALARPVTAFCFNAGSKTVPHGGKAATQ